MGVVARSDTENDPAVAGAFDPTCNGSILLCDRRLDEITFAASHNSHAAAVHDYLNGYRGVGITTQLENGIRGFLIDVFELRRSRRERRNPPTDTSKVCECAQAWRAMVPGDAQPESSRTTGIEVIPSLVWR